MNTAKASDEVIDMIASIELQRREVDMEAGRVAACGGALRRLQELLDREKEALSVNGPGTGLSANIEVLTVEIGKIRRLADMTGRLSLPRSAPLGQRGLPLRDAPRNPPRNRGRRTMGRSGPR